MSLDYLLTQGKSSASFVWHILELDSGSTQFLVQLTSEFRDGVFPHFSVHDATQTGSRRMCWFPKHRIKELKPPSLGSLCLMPNHLNRRLTYDIC